MFVDRDMQGVDKHLKSAIGLGGRPSGGQQPVKEENGVLLRKLGKMLTRWPRSFTKLLYTECPKLNEVAPTFSIVPGGAE